MRRSGIREGDRVALLEPRCPRLVPDVEDVVRVRLVRLRADALAIVDVAGEAAPGILAERAPFAQHLALVADLEHHVESRVRDQQVPFGRRPHVMQIVEARQRDVDELLELGQRVDDDLGLRARVQAVVMDGRRLEQDLRLVLGAGVRGRDVLERRRDVPRGRVDAHDHALAVLVPDVLIDKHAARGALLTPDDVKAFHDAP